MKTPTVKDVQKNKAILKIVDFFSNTTNLIKLQKPYRYKQTTLT